MPIPELNEHGVLPEGIYDCTLDEIGERFGRFQTTDRRVFLFERLRNLFDAERKAGVAMELVVDGSFTTDKVSPGDIDLMIVLPEDYNPGLKLPPFIYNAISKRRIRRKYPFDIFVEREHSSEYVDRINFFKKVKESELRKGMLRVKL